MVSKIDFANLETKVDNQDVDKLKTVPADLRKLSNAKISSGDSSDSTSRLVTKTQDNSDKQGIEKKIKNVDKKIYLPLLR